MRKTKELDTVTRDEIYDHLAQVYLGKRKKADIQKKRQLNAWLVINVGITGLIFLSVFYGLTAFLTQKKEVLQSQVVYALHSGVIQISYNFDGEFPPEKKFALTLPSVDPTRYENLRFSIRAREEGSPGVIKVFVENRQREKASYYVRDIDLGWKEVTIPLEAFSSITDWRGVRQIAFVLESWNVDQKKGVVLIDNVRFSGSVPTETAALEQEQ